MTEKGGKTHTQHTHMRAPAGLDVTLITFTHQYLLNTRNKIIRTRTPRTSENNSRYTPTFLTHIMAQRYEWRNSWHVAAMLYFFSLCWASSSLQSSTPVYSLSKSRLLPASDGYIAHSSYQWRVSTPKYGQFQTLTLYILKVYISACYGVYIVAKSTKTSEKHLTHDRVLRLIEVPPLLALLRPKRLRCVGHPLRRARRFSTNISLYLRNSTR